MNNLGTGLVAYLRLLRHRPAAVPFVSALLARLSISMAPLGLLLLVQQQRNTYGSAGFVTGAFAIGCAVGTPLWGRMMDRFGQVRTLLPTASLSAGFLGCCALAVVSGAPLWMLLALAATAGVTYPPISPAMRAGWRVIFPDPADRRVAFALDATSVELLFIIGPLVISALLALTTPVMPVLVTAGFLLIGGIGYCRTDVARRYGAKPVNRTGSGAPAEDRLHRSAITVPGVAVVLATMLSLSIGFGQLDTSLAGTAGIVLGHSDRVGVLFTAIAGGSVIGGLIFGARNWSLSERRALPISAGTFTVLLICVAGMISLGTPPLGLLLPLLFACGLVIAPSLIMHQRLMDHLAPTHRVNEAQAMLSAMTQVGNAVGTSIAGMMIDLHGLPTSFSGAAMAVGAGCVIAILSQRHWSAAIAAAQQRRLSEADLPV